MPAVPALIADASVAIDLRDEPVWWFTKVGGLTNVVRLLCALQHAGVRSVHLVGPEASRASAAFAKHPLFKRAKTGGDVISLQVASDVAEDSSISLLFRIPVVLSSSTIEALITAGITTAPNRLPEGMPGFLVPVSSAAEQKIATHAVLGSVGKPMLHSGIASVLLLQPIAKQLNRPLCNTPVTPNQVTILGFLLGLASLPLLWNGSRGHLILAVSLLFVANVLDQIDGQLARIKFLFSSYGEKLDHYLDEIIKVLLLAPIGVGLANRTGQEVWMYVGWVASGAQLFYTGAMFYYLWRFGGKNASSTNFKFWYNVKPPGSEPAEPATPANPNALKGRYFLRKDFVHTMFFIFGLANLIQIPFLLTVFGAVLYGGISLIQLVFFHRKVQIAGDHHGGV